MKRKHRKVSGRLQAQSQGPNWLLVAGIVVVAMSVLATAIHYDRKARAARLRDAAQELDARLSDDVWKSHDERTGGG